MKPQRPYLAVPQGLFIQDILWREGFGKEFLLTAVVMIIGVSLRFVPYITKNHTIQNTLFLILSVVGMSFFIIKDIGAITVWAVYIIFLLYSIVLNSNVHTFIFLVITLIIQVILGILYPKVYTVIDSAQYVKKSFYYCTFFLPCDT